jgi:general secretion pathway protein I
MERVGTWFLGIAAKARGARSARGFVLIDALVSLLITSLVIAVLFEAVSQNLGAAERVADRYQATLFARSKLASLGITDALSEGQSEGRFDAVFSWVLTVNKDEALGLDHEAASVVLYRVQLDVRWRRGSKQFQLSYKTRRVAPQKEASAAIASGVPSSETKRLG